MLCISFHSYSPLPSKIPLEVGCSHPTRSFLDKYFYYMETKTTFTNFKLWLKYYISLRFGIFLSLPSFLLAALCMSFLPLTSHGSGSQDAGFSRRRTARLVNGGLVCPSLPSANDLERHRQVYSQPGEVVLSSSRVESVHPEAVLCGILFPFHLRAARAEYSKGESTRLPKSSKSSWNVRHSLL